MAMNGKRVALALGAGGARGYAHLGVIQELRERGHEIVTVAGTSMGALVGGLIAAGKDEEFADWATALRQIDVLRLLDPKWRAGGAFNADGVVAELENLLGEQLIEDLPVPFTAVATDLESHREVWFQRGPLVKAIRASIGIPGVFLPVMWNGRVLVDGGLLNPLPMGPTAATPADLTIAVSLQGRRTQRGTQSPVVENSADVTADESGTTVFRRLRGKLGVGGETTTTPRAEPSRAQPDLRVADVMTLSWDAMQEMIARYRLAGLPPDVLITVPVDAARTLDFHRATEMIELGRQLTAKALDDAGC
ncbi:patatin-like phospholipase family protein [Nocardioides sp. YR527]|uniref:patatin-like phospholipase family protein n=1 Tax=Nocardioides sp. YR527 TaxID=1881028 RepID=UPI00210C7FAF|nr:patatin-like phospholipase family protein [Nocardioides sp. YR527]